MATLKLAHDPHKARAGLDEQAERAGVVAKGAAWRRKRRRSDVTDPAVAIGVRHRLDGRGL